MKTNVIVCALAFAGGLLLHFGLRAPREQAPTTPSAVPRLSVGQVATGAGFTSTLETFHESHGLRNAARLLERIDAAGPGGFPHLYALFAIDGQAWQEILVDTWAEKDPRGLLAYRLGISPLDDLDDATMAVFDALAIADPQELLGMLEAVPGREERNSLRWRLLSNLASGDKARASEWLAENAAVFTRSSLTGDHEQILDFLHYNDLVDVINGIPDSKTGAGLFRHLLRRPNYPLGDAVYYDAWRRIADPAIAADLFGRGYYFGKEVNEALAQTVFERAREILETNTTRELIDFVLPWAGAKGGIESMRQAFELALSARVREALGSTYVLGGLESLFENLEGERLDFLLANIDRLPLGETYRSAAERIGEEFARRGQKEAALAWVNGLEGNVRTGTLNGLAEKMTEAEGARAAIEYLQANVPPPDFADAMASLGRRIDETTPLEEVPSLAALLDPETRTRFLEALGSGRSTDAGPLLDAVASWPAADQHAVYAGFASQTWHYVSSKSPPLTPAQRNQLLAIAIAYLPDPERRAEFLKDVGVE